MSPGKIDMLPNLAVVVPARGGSKRVPGKNLRKLGDRTLLAHTADAIADAGLTGSTVLTSDDPAIIAEGKSLGWHAPFVRPDDLANDTAGTAETVLHALEKSRDALSFKAEWVLVLQPTSPFRKGEDIRNALTLAGECPNCDGVIGVRGIGLNTRYLFGSDMDGFMTPVVEPPHRDNALVPNGAIYLIRTAVLEKTRAFYDGRFLAYIMSDTASIDIDTEEDMTIAEALYDNRQPFAGNPDLKAACVQPYTT